MKKMKITVGKLDPAACADAPLQPRPTGNNMSVAYATVRPDPNQPRKTFSEASLQELADSITQQGILQPLILEHVPAKFRILEPELHDKEYRVEELQDGNWYRAFGSPEADACRTWAGELNLTEYYRIVCGERRWRAAGLVNLPELPAIVYRSLTDKQRFDFQFIENNQREAVTAIEEAEAIKKQLDDRKRTDTTFSPEKLAVELGISRAGIYERLKLTRLHPPIRAALLAGKISTSVAGEVAKLPTPGDQERLLKKITNEQDYQFPFSVRDVQELIDDDYVKQLESAPFDLKTEYPGIELSVTRDPDNKGEWVEMAKACTVCPYRTGNMLEQFPELKSRPNVCTNPDCFAAKTKAFWLAKAKDEAQRGTTVLTEKEFKQTRTEYVDATRESWGLFANTYGSPEKTLGKHAPEPVLVSTAEGLKKYYKRADIPEAAQKAKVKLDKSEETKAQTPEEQAKAEAKQKATREMGERRSAYVTSQIPELMKALAKLKSGPAWALGVALVKSHDGYCDDAMEAAAAKAKDDQARVLGFLFADNDNSPLGYSNEWEDHGVKLWKLAGVDLVAGFDQAEKSTTKELPLKSEPKQKTLLKAKPGKSKLSAISKAHILAAQKARWAKVKAAAGK
jgi:ParB/RepB/Spo0J family partition protein